MRSPHHKWFVGGKLNAAHNCLDRHARRARRSRRLSLGRRARARRARSLTTSSTRRFAGSLTRLKDLGVAKGDRVAIYMPMIPELPAAMLACARIGAAALGRVRRVLRRVAAGPDQRRRVQGPDHGRRRLPARADRAAEGRPPTRPLEQTPVDREGRRRAAHEGRRERWSKAATSSTTTSSRMLRPSARPSRWTPRTCSTSSTRRARPGSRRGSCTRPAATSPESRSTHHNIFDIKPETDVYWCAADIGWVTGHSYIVYGPLANGCTSILYEGAPDWPDKDRWWSIIEEYEVDDPLHGADRDPHVHEVGNRLSREARPDRRCGCWAAVGEPINPEAWIWYQEFIGGGRTRWSTPGGRRRPERS